MTLRFLTARLWAILLLWVLLCGASGAARAAGSVQAARAAVNSEAFRGRTARMFHRKYLQREATSGEAAAFAARWKAGDAAWKDALAYLLGSNAYFQKAGGTNEKFVARLFQDLAERAPDAEEELPASLDFLKGGKPRSELALAILDSDAARLALAQSFYQELLGREANEAEATAAANTLETGGINGLAVAIVTSPAYFGRSGGTMNGWQAALARDLLDDDAAPGAELGGVEMAEDEATPRAPGSRPARSAGGNSRLALVQAMLDSPEYQTGLVQNLYRKYLGRVATSGEVSAMLQAMHNGGSSDDVLAQVLTSDEYFNRAGGTTDAFLKRLSRDLPGQTGNSTKGGKIKAGDVLDILRNLPGRRDGN